ncbi:CopY/TcrY family copper transport repressor [Furfurilactobacillus siliginis]|uniref:Transcription regulator n=1 Tax=Furfurilactobacillus siliginis TaxID=348151 RepID=A0A0R2LCQ3_9LACO|nr:CopY/TcrY family copper transport repressor [Furfurilactobacillus siliginis]KRN96439.1 transcription regulator [Furfurilactobacillus siliginis]GEK29662.1 uracil phosphoribosyltransferase [Furfurilactobacillus siliginis]
MEATMQIEISDAEWEVMRVLWTLGHATSHQLTEILTEKMGWKPATTKTLLGRLVKKEILSTTKQGNAFDYKPLVEETAAMNAATHALFSHLCQMKAGQTLADLMTDLTFSQADVKKLQAVLEKKALTAPEQVPCNCLPDCETGQC